LVPVSTVSVIPRLACIEEAVSKEAGGRSAKGAENRMPRTLFWAAFSMETPWGTWDWDWAAKIWMLPEAVSTNVIAVAKRTRVRVFIALPPVRARAPKETSQWFIVLKQGLLVADCKHRVCVCLKAGQRAIVAVDQKR
jgi:hypothetical protein